ncbi:hypothetical protein PTKIN_Ptkin12aG0105100 [Pterospermum kingtungense]
MSAVDNGRNNLAGLTLDAVLGARRSEPATTHNRTLLDIIREDGSTKDKKSWKTFRDKLRLKRAGSAWTSSVPIPASDVNVHSSRSHLSRRGSFRSNSADSTHGDAGGERTSDSGPPVANSRLQMARRASVRFGNNPGQTDHDDSVDASMPGDAPPSRSFKPQMTRHKSTRSPASNTGGNDVDSSSDDDEEEDDEDSLVARELGIGERVLSAREAVAAQEAAEAAAAAAAAEENNALAAEEPVRMSLMDLLGESGSSYTMGEDDEEYDDEEDEDEDDEEEKVVEASGGIEFTCCVCMVRHKGSAFIPCGHTFCRLCSRELMVQRGNCPLCNGYILEILDIF